MSLIIFLTVVATTWYLLVGLGFYKLLAVNKLRLSRPPLIFSLIGWPIMLVVAGLCKEE